MTTAEMYSRTVESLKRSIEQHRNPDGRMSQRAFCEAYGFSRQNLQLILAQEQDLSVGLFLQIAAALAGRQAPAAAAALDRWSLKTWLGTDSYMIHLALHEVNFRDTGIVQKGKNEEIST